MGNDIPNIHNKLENIMAHTEQGAEYWEARQLQAILGYSNWDNFEGVIKRAIEACQGAGVDPNNQFLAIKKKVSIGSGAERERTDYLLGRYACYLIAMNGKASKPEIASAQSYFAIQTRRMEINDHLLGAEERIQLRNRVKANNRKLSDAAKEAGVKNFGLFHDSGYRAMYGGKGVTQIKEYKGLSKKDDLLDRAGRAELAANDFRITQAELRITGEKADSEKTAIELHKQVGKEVRETMKRTGKTLPEDLPTEPSIKKIESELKKQKKLRAGN